MLTCFAETSRQAVSQVFLTNIPQELRLYRTIYAHKDAVTPDLQNISLTDQRPGLLSRNHEHPQLTK